MGYDFGDSIRALTTHRGSSRAGEIAFDAVYRRAFGAVVRAVGEDAAQDAALSMVRILRPLSEAEVVRRFEDSLRRMESYYWTAARNALYTALRNPDVVNTILLSELVDPESGGVRELPVSITSTPDGDYLDFLDVVDRLSKMYRSAGPRERRDLLFRVAMYGYGARAANLQAGAFLEWIAADAGMRALAVLLFGTSDTSALRPSTWDRSTDEVVWSSGTIGSGLARAEDMIRAALDMVERVPVERRRGS